MANVSSKFKATVSFGGTVSSSFLRSSAALQNEIKRTEKETDKLKKKQQALLKSIREGGTAGRDVDELRRQYQELGRAIEASERRSERLNRSLRKRRGVSFAGKHLGLTAMRENIRERGRAVRDKGLLPTVVPGMTRTVGMGLGVATGIAGAAVATNAQTAEESRIAKSYGVGLGTFKAWGGVAKQSGLQAENIGDLVEELANKAGEFKSLGKQSSLEDGLMMLGLTPGDLKGKSNEEQFAMILNRAAKAKDPQVARSAIDMIMGGEGNKIITAMKAMGKSYEELIAEQNRYVLLTKEGEDGASRGQLAMDNLWMSVSTAAQEVLGVVMGDLAPGIQKWVDDFGSWFRTGGRDIIIKKLEAFGSGVKDFWENQLSPVLSSLWVGLKWLADFIDKHLTTYEEKTAKAKTREEVRTLSEEEGLRQAAELGLSPAQVVRHAKTFSEREVERWEQEKSRASGWLGTAYAANSGASLDDRLNASLRVPDIKDGSKKTNNQNNNLVINVQTQPGDDALAIGAAVGDSVFNVLKDTSLDNGTYSPALMGG